MISHYTAIVIMSCVAMLGMAVGINANSFIDNQRKRYFQWAFVLIIIVNLAEYGAVMLDGHIELRSLRVALKFMEFTFSPFVVLAALMTVGNRATLHLGVLICSVNELFQIVSLFNGIVFSIDAAGVYHRNTFYPVYIISFLMMTVILVYVCLRYINKFQLKNIILLITIIIMELCSLGIQMFLSHLHLDWSMGSICLLLFYIYLDQLQQQTDPLTQLLNRRIYEVHIQKLPNDAVIIFFDVDSFKEVNDTYGHSVGDKCLVAVGEEILRVFGKVGYCYRYGGDEFCVVLKRDNGMLKELLHNFSKNVEYARYNGFQPLPRVSYGYATLTDGKSFAEVVEEADTMMYEYKKKFKEI